MEIREIATLLALVREEVGISLVPALAIPPDTKGIAAISLEPRTTRRLAVMIDADSPQSPAARAFLRATAESAQQEVVPSPI